MLSMLNMAMATFSLLFAYEGGWTHCSGKLSRDHETMPLKPSFQQAFLKRSFEQLKSSIKLQLMKHIFHHTDQMSRSTSATLIVPCSYHSLVNLVTELHFNLAPTQSFEQYGSWIPGKHILSMINLNSSGHSKQQSLVSLSSSVPSSFKQTINSSNARNFLSKFQEVAATYTQKSILESNTSNR